MAFTKHHEVLFATYTNVTKVLTRTFHPTLCLSRDRASPPTLPPPKIKLTQWERQTFLFLRRAAHAFKGSPVRLRVAGGWVRDKLLGRNTGDIDVAIENTTGALFALHVHHYAKSLRQNSSPFIGPSEFVPSFCSVKCIAAKPANSRHLETAAVHMDGLNLDFVQLRSEDYANSSFSRVPSTVVAASPAEDAYRRDFTVNSLFYNIHTHKVEDWTERGISDLSQGVLHTPLDASETLRDDPLRALRAVRFACKLGFRLSEPLHLALSSPELHSLIIQKVSRERVSHELFQVIRSQRLLHGLRLVWRYGLVRSIFLDAFGSDEDTARRTFLDRMKRLELALQLLQEALDTCSEKDHQAFRQEDKTVLVLAVLTWEISQIQPIIKDALRQTRSLQRDVTHVAVLGRNLETLLRQPNLVDIIDTTMADDAWIDFAEILRDSGEHLWIPTVIFGALCSNVMDLFPKFLSVGLNGNVCRVKPLVDGNKLKKELELRKGPEVGRALRELIRLQLGNTRILWEQEQRESVQSSERSSKMDAEDCLRMLKRRLPIQR